MPTTILDGETYEQARHRRFTEEAKVIEKIQQDEIVRMAREAGSIDSEDVIETVWAAFAAAERAEQEPSKQQEALQELKEWQRAYPLSVFPEPDYTKAQQALESVGMTLDSLSASTLRLALDRVMQIVEEALEQPNCQQLSTSTDNTEHQEPVAWIKQNEDGVYVEDVTGFPVYTSPPQRECDEINYEDWEFNPMTGESLWGKEPPQRPWVEPSDEQIEPIVHEKVMDMRMTLWGFARAVLKLAKELNR